MGVSVVEDIVAVFERVIGCEAVYLVRLTLLASLSFVTGSWVGTCNSRLQTRSYKPGDYRN